MRRTWLSKAFLGLTMITALWSCEKEDEAAPAQFVVDPTTKNFGQVRVNETIKARFTVSNPGELPLELLGYSLSGDTPEGFTSTGEPTTMYPDDTYSFEVSFAPQEEGNQDAVLNISTNIGDKSISLSGFGLPALVPAADVSVTELDFEAIIVNTSTSLPVTLTNTGNTELEITSIAIVGEQAAAFSTAATVETLAIQANKEILVDFAPTVVGAATAILEIITNAGTKTVALTGNADPEPAPVLEVSTTSIDFGDVHLRQEKELMVTLTNTGNLPLTIASTKLTGDQEEYFDLDIKEMPTLAPGTSFDITVSFYPEALGAATATFSMETNGGNAVVDLSGTGIPAPEPRIILDPEALDFQQVTVGNAKQLTFTISNGGPGTLDISQISVGGAHANDFSLVTGSEPTQLANGEGVMVTVQFAPQTAGDKIALINISSNDPAKGQLAFMVIGKGAL